MDAFEKRIQFIEILKRLSSSQQSISKVVAYAVRNAQRCGDDLWACLVEECEKAPVNAKINIFYALDGLMEASVQSGTPIYLNLLKRDLAKVVDIVAPATTEGVLNLMSTRQILKSWKIRRVLDPDIIEPIEENLEVRPSLVPLTDSKTSSARFANFSRGDILRRIEDDRERHKRLREKLWILPPPTAVESHLKPAVLSLLTTASTKASSQSPFSPASPAQPAQIRPGPPKPTDEADAVSKRAVDPIAIEFEQLWEAELKLIQEDEALQRQPRVGGLTDDDWVAMRSEDARCFGQWEA